ncbi:molybdopterin-dependent oxidoreductase (plasmid) [Pseudohalocynthiibacter aestuariivivens]|nr:molybdopterin-dependent oxidoreductase [Pseudohalocynthiibacter aestuariivivens]QIE48188.1 molybdopterin-dependent oxidoreductase [Pseudohalocynthiibacter aestuariivivens]
MSSDNPLSLLIDLERCIGCKSCEAACKQSNALGPHTYRNRVMWYGDDPETSAPFRPALMDFLTVTCQQCERPACLRACPVTPKAISKDPETGVVQINEDRCTGCGECAVACPYGAIGYNAEKHHAVKCDLCAHRRAEGDGPACASVCPTTAIQFGYRDDHLAKARDEGREVLDTDQFLQKPATVYFKRIGERDRSGATVPQLMADDATRSNLQADVIHGTYDMKIREAKTEVSVTEHRGGCNICFNACPLTYEMRDGQITNIYGTKEDPIFKGRVCPKSQMTLQLYDNPNRLLKPLKRVGARGSGKFREISWNEALEEIAAKLLEIRVAHGPESLAIQAGSRTGVLNIMGAVPLFADLWGTDNVAATEPFCDLGKSVSLELTQGSTMLANVYTSEDIGSAKLYVYIGDNQAETRPVNFGLVNNWRLANKAKMVVVDPRQTVTASKADDWLAIRPGTDMALGLAMIHHILEQALQDMHFCANWIEGFEEWRGFIFDKGYTPDWAAPITDLPVDVIKTLARDIAQADGCMIYLSRGVNQHVNSAQTNRVYQFLAAITGNYGRKGGGFFNVSSEPDWKYPHVPEGRKPTRKPAISKNPAAWADAMLGEDHYPIKALITGNNPMSQWPDLNKARRAVKSLDLIVHMDLFRNATSEHADYVLPMASGIEKGGTTRFAEDRRIVWNDKLMDPPGEARSDHWFWIELGKRFGFEDILQERFKNPRVLWDEVLCSTTPELGGLTTKRLLKQPSRWLRMPVRTEDEIAPETLYLEGTTAFMAPQGHRFPTPSGKLEFYNAFLDQRFAEFGLSALPEFYTEKASSHLASTLSYRATDKISSFFHTKAYAAPVNLVAPDPHADGAFETELVTGRPPAPHFHSWTHYFWEAQEMWPEAYCQIHPSKARSLGIKDGDRVEVRTEHGEITLRAWLYAGIRKNTIFIPIGWDETQPFHPSASVNKLLGLALDPISQQPNLKLHMCNIRKL